MDYHGQLFFFGLGGQGVNDYHGQLLGNHPHPCQKIYLESIMIT